MADEITGSNTGVGNATDGNGGNNMNTDQTGQAQGGGAGAPSGASSTSQGAKGAKKWADEDNKNREKLKANQFGRDTVEWYDTILNAFSYDVIKKSKNSDAKNQSLISLQDLSFKLTLAMSKAASSAVDTALKAADKRYKKK